MSKEYYLPQADARRDLWLQNYAAKLPNYAAKYNISRDDVEAVANAATDFSYRRAAQEKVAAYGRQWTAYKNALRDGLPAGATAQVPVAPDLRAAPAAAPNGIFALVARMVTGIKGSSSYSEADGQDLGIEGAENRPDVAGMAPELSPKQGTAGRAGFDWKKQDTDGIAVYKDSGNGFVKYDMDNYPPYEDKAPLPAGVTAWKYKAIYLLHDEEVGQFSPVITVNVGG